MGQSYRIRTEVGINKTITVQLDQEFEFLEILSLKLQQEDIYTRSCADYGVIVGRVTANNGLGIPNARVSIFIPVGTIDQSNPVISSVYPYLSPSDKNEDGYRYNLLPYEKSYSKHAATGTLPSRTDVLTNQTAVEIYDKYYKFTSKTNESGDYMIMGVPLGEQQVVMDVDLSDIGEFSLTPQDLIRIGRATESQVAGNTFRTSTDLNSLPQIVNLTKTIEISPLWGESAICEVAINRVDFDLRDDANIEIQPTSVFMGSIFSTSDQFRLRNNCRPRESLGNLCNLESGPGQILAIRQTINQDDQGYPILEQHVLEQQGNIIDGDGTWVTELPMNLDYYTTNEFGEKVISNDPAIGIPTKAKYRFKIKWQQANDLTQQTRRAYFLVPNVREFGWTSTSDPNYLSTTSTQGKQLASSYYFGLDWSGYTDGLTTSTDVITKANEIINCEDTFYFFEYNRVYTISGLIDQYKNGRDRGKFIGIKEIDDNSCSSSVNKFPVNDGVRNFDAIFFVFSILLQIVQIIGVPIIIVLHFIAWVWNEILVPFKALFTALWIFQVGWYLFGFVTKLVKAKALAIASIFPPNPALTTAAAATETEAWQDLANSGKWAIAGTLFEIANRATNKRPFPPIKLTSLTYPSCQTCQCSGFNSDSGIGSFGGGTLTNFDDPINYSENISTKTIISTLNPEDVESATIAFSQAVGTNVGGITDRTIYKTMKSEELAYPSSGDRFFNYSVDLPLAERINIFNLRKKYFDGVNRISVTFDSPRNATKHFDNTITIISKTPFDTGTLFTFVDPTTTQDVNFRDLGISGVTLNSGQSTYNVEYATSQTTNGTVSYVLSTGSTITNYRFPSDIEYYQVLTALTISDASKIWQNTSDSSLPGILNSSTVVRYNERTNFLTGWGSIKQYPPYKIGDLFTDFDNQYILILQRGVDPYSPTYVNKYGIGKLLGFPTEDSVVITGNTRLNIPIQKLTNTSASVQLFNSQNNIFYPSHFFRAGDGFSSFTTSVVGYYSGLDATNPPPYTNFPNPNGVRYVVTYTSNDAYSSTISAQRYDLTEDLSGGAYYYVVGGNKPDNTVITYYTSSLLPSLISNPMSISSKVNNVLRTDRLPSSDYLDGSSWSYNPSLLQQNIGFKFYEINTEDQSFTVQGYGGGADIVTAEISGLTASQNVFDTFECRNMVSLSCYSGNSTSFGVKLGCPDQDSVENGCYVIMKKPLTDLFNGKDLRAWSEWGYRFRFFYGLCRGVLSQTFVNNWVNGSLFAYPLQVDTSFNSQNKIGKVSFCKDTIYFDEKTNNFYYRSSPYNNTSNLFVGKSVSSQVQPINRRLLQYPTTIINLGWKDSFYSEIILDPSTNAYIMDQLNPTSYSDTSDLVNLFVISRITDENFIQRITSGLNPDNSLNQLFSRPERRIDGDLAQLMSINSEEGVIKFSPEYYSLDGSTNQPVVILNPISTSPTIGVFFSSTTTNLQFKDFITPGRINFRPTTSLTAVQYNFGIKSQEVPFYQWGLNDSSNTIFGNEQNNWVTNYDSNLTSSGIFSRKYQSNDRTNKVMPSYFIGSSTNISDTFGRGYIFNVIANPITGNFNYSLNYGNYPNKFLVGAPFHFYFGLNKGLTALDKFKTKYSIGE